jgi:hypothetical protein
VTSEETIGYLGSLLSLSSFFDRRDNDHNSSQKLLLGPQNLNTATLPCNNGDRNKLTLAFKVMIGWYYLHDSSSAEKWGEDWFKFIVIRTHDIITEDPRRVVSELKTKFYYSSLRYSYQPSVPESARDTLAVHAAAIAASDSQSKLSSISLADLTRELENIYISRESNDQAHDPLVVALEDDAIPDSIVLDSRINQGSLSKFRPLANLSSRPKRHSQPDVDSQSIDKSTLPNKEDEEPKRVNISRKSSLSTGNSTKDSSSPSSIEKSLNTAFEGLRIGSLKTTVKNVEPNRSKPKVVIKPETSSLLAGGSANSATAIRHCEHLQQKAIGPEV